MYINFHKPSGSLTIDSNAAHGVEDIGYLADCLESDGVRAGCASCPLEGAKDTLEDGEYWQGAHVSPETLEELHALICEYEDGQIVN